MTAAGARARRDVEEWATRAREATTRRDAAMVRMIGYGASLREVAAAAGMSHSAVARIVARVELDGVR